MATRTRQPIKALAPSPATVAKAAAADKQRKTESKRRLREALKAAGEPDPAGLVAAAAILGAQQAKAAQARAQEYAANALRTAQEDAALTGLSVEQVLADMGLDPTGHPLPTGKPGTAKATYTGPMLALRERAKRGAYLKGANGNPHTNDRLALLCSVHSREVVVKALIAALKLGFNPYSQLNPGQQSMNLRNKARAAIKNGLLQMSEVEAELAAAA